MKTIRKNHGPFTVVRREIRAKLKSGPATLTCSVQRGFTPLGRAYRYGPEWWVKLDGAPCADGPWTADNIREHRA